VLIFDGLGSPLKELAKKDGNFLKRGSFLDSIDKTISYEWTKVANKGDIVRAGHVLGLVKEGIFLHRIVVPFNLTHNLIIKDIIPNGHITGLDVLANLISQDNGHVHNVAIWQKWPVKIPITAYSQRLLPNKPLLTKTRIVDALFPIAEGGTACIPGPFGSGKTVFQQSVARYCDADIVIIAACGERAGEVTETLCEFPHIIDPKTGRNLMERTIIICNTSSMPVAAREASIYTAITMGEYYRHMGLKVLVLADSTSRWAQAMREMSGRLEEIPGEEAYPAYLNSSIRSFYERAGVVRIDDPKLGGSIGSLTLIGTVSPAGGNFEEPVTQATLLVAGSFWGLSYARSYAKRFPAIAVLESYSKYFDRLEVALDECFGDGFVGFIKRLKFYYAQGQIIADQMKVVGEDDISLVNFVTYLKSDFIDAAFFQQNAFNEVDACCDTKRMRYLLDRVMLVVEHDFSFMNKEIARAVFLQLKSLFRDLNITKEEDPVSLILQNEINEHIKVHSKN
jgi:V/A-type H+-transporting ATPase subunit A